MLSFSFTAQVYLPRVVAAHGGLGFLKSINNQLTTDMPMSQANQGRFSIQVLLSDDSSLHFQLPAQVSLLSVTRLQLSQGKLCLDKGGATSREFRHFAAARLV